MNRNQIKNEIPMGIQIEQMFEVAFYRLTPEQRLFNEASKIDTYFNDLISECGQEFFPNVAKENIGIHFINHGNSELVYVLTDGKNRFTATVAQPHTAFGNVKKEFDNLTDLSKKNENSVICPLKYFSNGKKEGFVSPYLTQARCVAKYLDEWGVYVPEPTYEFCAFTKKQTEIVTSCMIAKLIELYDSEKELGVANCNLGLGGDFMLEKDWSTRPLNVENTMEHLKLIACRDRISVSLEDYITLLRNEYGKNSNLINRDNSDLIKKSYIRNGIELGLKYRAKNLNIEQQK